MQLVKTIERVFLSYVDPSESPWWVEIVTTQPSCTYYFGSFSSQQEAERAQSGYLEDLAHEGAEGIAVQIKQCQPKDLTICEEELPDGLTESLSNNRLPVFEA